MGKREKYVVHPELGKPTGEEKALTIDALAKAIGRSLELSRAGEIGASDSGHGVFFALDTKRDDRGNYQSYAIKRYGNSEKAEKEINMLHKAAKRGLRTLQTVLDEPLAVPGVIGVSVVTLRIPSLGTMNSIPWSEYYAGQSSYGLYIVPVINSIGRYIGSLHAMGMHHGDMQLKNIATVPLPSGDLPSGNLPPGNFVTFDLENAYFHPDKGNALRQTRFQNDCMKDITTVIKSFIQNGLLDSSSDNLFWQEIQENLLLPYMELNDNLSSFLSENDRYKEFGRYINENRSNIKKSTNDNFASYRQPVIHL